MNVQWESSRMPREKSPKTISLSLPRTASCWTLAMPWAERLSSWAVLEEDRVQEVGHREQVRWRHQLAAGLGQIVVTRVHNTRSSPEEAMSPQSKDHETRFQSCIQHQQWQREQTSVLLSSKDQL